MHIAHFAIWAICALTIAGVLFRPAGIGEWIWALGGALLLVICRLLSVGDFIQAVGRGTDVYLFLIGMMVLAEVARREGVFYWIAGRAVAAARGSRQRLFVLVYAVGIVVTTVLSNDATAVVLTPAVAAVVRKARAEPLPFLLACAFIANAASFVLPISNPANLVVFAARMPPLGVWLRTFTFPSLAAIGATFVVLLFVSRANLRGTIESEGDAANLSANGRIALYGIGLTALALIVASALGAPLGIVTCLSGGGVLGAVVMRDRQAGADVVRTTSWSVLALVAGLFVLVEGVERTGFLRFTRAAIEAAATWPVALGVLGAGGVTALVSNAVNNLPAGLIAGSSLTTLHAHDALRSAVAIGIDLGPNLSVTGSLATVLWLIALRRERIEISAWTFLRVGALVMPVALVLALESLLLTASQ